MSRGRHLFRKADIKRAVEAVSAAGVPIARVVIAANGTIVVVAGKPGQGQDAGAEVNEWDSVQ